MTITGIDVSNYQSEAYDLTHAEFVFVKATQATNYVNPKHAAQVARARANHRVVGHYHYLTATPSVTAQMDYFLTHAAAQPDDVLAVDWEEAGVSCAEKDAALKYLKSKASGHKVLLYCSQSYWTGRDTTNYAADGLWVAQYNGKPGKPSIKATWLLHQYTSTPVDTSVAAFSSRAEMAAWAAGTTEDPMAGMTKQDVHDAVWRIDDITAGSTEKNPKNTTWQPDTFLKGTFENTVRLLGQTAAISKLISLLGSEVDTDTVVTAVTKAVDEAVAKAVVRVTVDVTGTDTSAPKES
ncbi:glycoside hydrolase family 25 protein [Streptomyces sp. NPDC058202]|uniref:glycoside hydrolase family 25 protein n=1 Tax=Streptomyces sp. NPDC058202 TaxID=3346380 RepID=UPI0036EA56F6